MAPSGSAGLPPGVGHARFDDLVGWVAWVFDRPVRVVQAGDIAAVRGVLDEVEAATATGRWAYGYVAFEAAPAFDPAFAVRPPRQGDPPLAWFAIADPPRVTTPVGVTTPGAVDAATWVPAWTAEQHAERTGRVLDAIVAGQLYQCNLTMPMRGRVDDPAQMYRRLMHAQAAPTTRTSTWAAT